ncbi:MAG: carboxypeptidase regulatory-like domain-containing protein [Acidobacteria bacterium]|nr:carboxypeptidase regulatory-like domain-containing protein [Acidobacteriota bacterium]
MYCENDCDNRSDLARSINHARAFARLVTALFAFCLATQAAAQTGTLKGRLKLQDSKKHDAVTVKAQRFTGTKAVAEPVETQTNEKGEYVFEKLPVGEYVLTYAKPGFKTFTTRRQPVASDETVQIKEFTLGKEGEPYASIRGAVLYGVGYSMPNALVTIERIDGGKRFKQEKYSQEGGEFGFTVKAEKAKYRITAQARGFQIATTEIEIDGDELRNIALTLQPIP